MPISITPPSHHTFIQSYEVSVEVKTFVDVVIERNDVQYDCIDVGL
jgi:hypothetical protein